MKHDEKRERKYKELRDRLPISANVEYPERSCVKTVLTQNSIPVVLILQEKTNSLGLVFRNHQELEEARVKFTDFEKLAEAALCRHEIRGVTMRTQCLDLEPALRVLRGLCPRGEPVAE